jgi:hypothetical protein
MVLDPLLDLGRFFSLLILYSVGRTPWTGDRPVARPLPTHRRTQRENKRTHTTMPRVGFEPTIPLFERAKTVHALDRSGTVIGDVYTLGSCALKCLSPRRSKRHAPVRHWVA